MGVTWLSSIGRLDRGTTKFGWSAKSNHEFAAEPGVDSDTSDKKYVALRPAGFAIERSN